MGWGRGDLMGWGQAGCRCEGRFSGVPVRADGHMGRSQGRCRRGSRSLRRSGLQMLQDCPKA